MRYTATKCPCGHPACKHWHVDPIAAVQGVAFTEAQANFIADVLNLAQVIGEQVESATFTLTVSRDLAESLR